MRTDVVSQLTFVLLLVFIPDLLQLLLTEERVLALVNYLLSLDLVVDLSEKVHQPFCQLEELVIVAVL